ncbi:MAG: amidohydrolase family protein, partial [Butyrivibrio sp.]|nr:amidohydrolase family protein [Butyrivibrio sp.]
HKAVNHSNPSEAVSVQDALRMCTYNGYYTTFDEKERGSLEECKMADMVILSENPYAVPADKLINLKVEKLFLGGKEYRPQAGSVAGTVLSGLFSNKKA